MIRVGAFMMVSAFVLWGLSYFTVFLFGSMLAMFLSTLSIGTIGGILIFIGVMNERLKQHKEDKNIDYSKY